MVEIGVIVVKPSPVSRHTKGKRCRAEFNEQRCRIQETVDDLDTTALRLIRDRSQNKMRILGKDFREKPIQKKERQKNSF